MATLRAAAAGANAPPAGDLFMRRVVQRGRARAGKGKGAEPARLRTKEDSAAARPRLPVRRRRRAASAQRKRAERGFVTGFTGRETAPARPSQGVPPITAESALPHIPLHKLLLSPTTVPKP